MTAHQERAEEGRVYFSYYKKMLFTRLMAHHNKDGTKVPDAVERFPSFVAWR